jgi:hypothetical protein
MKPYLSHIVVVTGLSLVISGVCFADGTSTPGKAAKTTVTPPHRMTATRINYPPPVTAPAEIHLTAQFAVPHVSIGNIVLLQAVLENDGKDTIYMQEYGAAWLDFTLSVKDASGHDVPLTAWGKAQAKQVIQMAHSDGITMNVQRSLGPGEKVRYQFVLNRQFDLSQVGIYHVSVTQASVLLSATQRTLPIVSNEADVELLEPTPEIENPQNLGH